MPSSRCGTILSFRYVLVGAPPGRGWDVGVLYDSPVGVLLPAPPLSVGSVPGLLIVDCGCVARDVETESWSACRALGEEIDGW